MKSKKAWPMVIWAIASALVIAGLIEARAAHVRFAVENTESLPAPGIPALADGQRLQAYAAELRTRNPFRLERTPSQQTFGSWAQENAAPASIDIPEMSHAEPWVPQLSIGGLVGGSSWSAVIEGIPGHERGVLLRVGEELNGVQVVWIRSDSVAIATADTVWVLTLKQPWR